MMNKNKVKHFCFKFSFLINFDSVDSFENDLEQINDLNESQ